MHFDSDHFVIEVCKKRNVVLFSHVALKEVKPG